MKWQKEEKPMATCISRKSDQNSSACFQQPSLEDLSFKGLEYSYRLTEHTASIDIKEGTECILQRCKYVRVENQLVYEPCCEKIGVRSYRPGLTQTGLCNH